MQENGGMIFLDEESIRVTLKIKALRGFETIIYNRQGDLFRKFFLNGARRPIVPSFEIHFYESGVL